MWIWPSTAELCFLSADTSRNLVTLTFWPFEFEPWSYMAGHVTNLATKFEDPMPIRSWVTSFNVSRWVGGQKQLHFWNARPRFDYSLCNFGGSTMKVIKVICENNARPCVKRRMSFCAHAKSRDQLKVPEMSYCIRSSRRRFTVLDWAYSRI